MLTHGSLFTGIGGFDLGFERAGIATKWQVEINDFCVRVLERHFPNARRFRDVRECDDGNLDAVDVISGGDPCQENANARRATETTTAPSLGAEFIRVVERLRPRIVVRENPAAVRADAPWPWFRFRAELERLGYTVLPFRLRACCVGADIRRDRLFLLGELQKPKCTGLEGNEREVVAGTNDRRQDADAPGPDRWSATPRICGSTPRIPDRMDRLKSLGNCVLPAIAEWIGHRIVAAEEVRGV